MKQMLFIAAIVLTISACSTPVKHWTEPAYRRTSMEQDREDCQFKAQAATASYVSGSGLGTAIGDGINIAQERIKLTDACMRAKGYVASH